jgi:tRNA threonylcarbamoyl adenosine modification protein YeaZ
MVKDVLERAKIDVDSIDLLACTVGPGSFTGIRIGVALVKGLAFGKAIPCVGVSTLEATAWALREASAIIVPVTDARRCGLYNAVFESDGEKLTRLTPDKLDLPDELLLIPMDPILIEQVIVNILENAVHHAEGFTRLSLSVFKEGDEAIFEIADNGCGIDKDKLDTIFSGYVNALSDKSDNNRRGLGIGLSVCATIIKAHGGKIEAENAKSGGAVFRFSLSTMEETG